LLAFGIGLAGTSGALAALHAVTGQPGRAAEVAVLVAANLVSTAVRFALHRNWVFRGRGTAPAAPAVPGAAARPAPPPNAAPAHTAHIHPNGSSR
jgi:putative flippase GtrA